MRLLLALFTGIMFSFVQAEAATYEWLDDQGVTHFTDDPDRVPTKFLEKVKTRESISGDSARQSEPQAESKPLPVPAPIGVTDYGGHSEGWWRSSFTNLRSEIQALKDSLTGKNEELSVLGRKKRIYQRSSDRFKYNKQQESIERDQSKIAELELRLIALENEATRAGVPFDWRR